MSAGFAALCTSAHDLSERRGQLTVLALNRRPPQLLLEIMQNMPTQPRCARQRDSTKLLPQQHRPPHCRAAAQGSLQCWQAANACSCSCLQCGGPHVMCVRQAGKFPASRRTAHAPGSCRSPKPHKLCESARWGSCRRQGLQHSLPDAWELLPEHPGPACWIDRRLLACCGLRTRDSCQCAGQRRSCPHPLGAWCCTR